MADADRGGRKCDCARFYAIHVLDNLNPDDFICTCTIHCKCSCDFCAHSGVALRREEEKNNG